MLQLTKQSITDKRTQLNTVSLECLRSEAFSYNPMLQMKPDRETSIGHFQK